ncbi:MAG: enoyl-CoA hydratase/isomerase family protein [Aestuariibacter sp.]
MSEITYSRDGDVAIITFNNAPVNAFSRTFESLYREHILKAMNDNCRALLTRAEGPNFCAGADVNMFVDKDRRHASGLVSSAINMMNLIESLPIPTVCSVNGIAIAAGMEIMMAHDIAIVGESAQIGQTEALIGTATLAGGAQRLAARVGIARAKQMVFEGRMYDAQTLERWNVVNMVVPDNELDKAALAYTKKLAAGPTVALSVGKTAINAFAGACLGPADQVVMSAAPQVFETIDKKQGVATFLKHGAKAFASGSIKFKGH